MLTNFVFLMGIFYIAMSMRYAYLGYAAYPKLIEQSRAAGEETNIAKLEQGMKGYKMKMWSSLWLGLGTVFSIGVIEWMRFLQQAVQSNTQ